jgi:methionyl-tRNA formyltransferase
MKVLFWGTPEFATPSLRALIGEGYDVVGVVTQPDRPQGRSRTRLVAPPVKVIAIEEGIPIWQPEKPRGAEFLDEIAALEPDASVVVAYGNILTPASIDVPKLGTFNVHASLLPHLRGAAPIQAAIRDGLSETGVTIMRLVPALDAGPMLLRRSTPIADDETYGELSLRLAELGAVALIEALTLLTVGAVIEQPQDDSAATYAPKLDRDATRIHWSRPAAEVARHIRAYDPRPGAVTTAGPTEVKLFGATVVPELSPHPPGTVYSATSTSLHVACGDSQVIAVEEVQPAGKARMPATAWLNGRGTTVGARLGA